MHFVVLVRAMKRRTWHWGKALGLAVTAAFVGAACGGNGSTNATGGGHGGAASGSGGMGGTGNGEGGGGLTDFTTSSGSAAGGGQQQGFDVQPSAPQTIEVALGQKTPTVTFSATLNGQPINAGWVVDRGNIGTVGAGPSSLATFTPTGTTGGLVKVTAGLNNKTIERQVMVLLKGEQNGYDPNNPAEQAQIPADVTALKTGGGVGGVGGEGLGQKVTEMATLDALKTPVGDGQAQGLTFLYPYDHTVWPRGLLAPLLMWSWSFGDADAIQIELSTTSKSFSWKGTFGRPAILEQTKGPFIRHPIPQDVWEAATNTAGGPTPDGSPDKLTVSLTVAKGGQAYGPISETWTIAPARLSGIIYYNSYGTQLAKNYSGAVGGDGKFGGAVLSIHVGDTSPKLTAGANGTSAQCRVCHSVAADGSRLIAQRGDATSQSSVYTLDANGNATESAAAVGMEFPGIYPDGSKALAPNAQLRPLPDDASALPTSGLTSVATSLGTPAFSPDGKAVAFNPMAGPGVTNPTQKLVVMGFDPASNTFSNPLIAVDNTGQAAETRPGWPAFFPDGTSVVYHQQIKAGVDGNGLGDLRTRKGAKAFIAWASATAAQAPTPLDELNGKDAAGNVYLPKLAQAVSMSCTGDGAQVGNIEADHSDDVNLNYEPTVNPVASGGYVWVVFTSRRLYGNVATIPPFCSDPRGVDLVQNITTKKLWVAAIDVNGQPGKDASHPAFYLPAQELLAGNARGFWVLDKCRSDGSSCMSGDQCCGGYCQPDASGALVCSNTPPSGMCSQPQEKCTSAADCCDPTNLCVNGFCTQKPPN
jgi:hypothetical protein